MKIAPYILTALLFTGCVSKPPRADRPNLQGSYAKDKISLMTFNVENLFDLEDDPEKNDEAFLPLEMKQSEAMQNKCRVQNQSYQDKKKKSEKDRLLELESEDNGMDEFFTQFRVNECLTKNWSKGVLERKMSRLADVMKQVNDGYGPDIVMLQEVENEGILRQWRDEYLSHMGYQTLVLIEGPDERGIDTALLSRLPLTEPAKLHEVDFSKDPEIEPSDIRPTRGLLEARLKLPNGDRLAVFTVHFPSQGASTAHRRVAAQALIEAAAQVPKDMQIVVGGDFNITSREEWKHRYFRDLLGKDFATSFLVGLEGQPGSTYFPYDQTWSYFDVLLFSKPLVSDASAWALDKSSLRVVNTSFYQLDQEGKPAKFRSGYGSVGVSDHWPVYAELNLKSQTVVRAK